MTFILDGKAHDVTVSSHEEFRKLFLTSPDQRLRENDELELTIWPNDEEPLPFTIELGVLRLYFSTAASATNFNNQADDIVARLQSLDDQRRAAHMSK